MIKHIPSRLATEVANALLDRGYRAYPTARGLDRCGIVLRVHKPFDLHGLEETAARLFDSSRRPCGVDEP